MQKFLKSLLSKKPNLALLKRRLRKFGDSYLNFNKTDNHQIIKFLNQNNLEFKQKPNGQIVVKACPLCPKSHNNKSDNLWTLNIKGEDGAFLCFRCGQHGGWSEFVKNFIADGHFFGLGNKIDPVIDPIMKERNFQILQELFIEKKHNLKLAVDYYNKLKGKNIEIEDEIKGKKYVDIVRFLVEERCLDIEVLKEFEMGIGEEMFKDEFDNLKLVKCVYFPMKTRKMLHKNEEEIVTKVKIKGIGQDKKYLRTFPSGADFGVFSKNMFSSNSSTKALVITEGEYDAMSVYQTTKIPVVSLPFGASNLPHNLIPFLDKFERIYLWMDFDSMGQINVETFANKIGKSKTYVVKEIKNDDLEIITKSKIEKKIKDANDVIKIRKDLIWDYLKRAEALPQKNIIKFSEIRSKVKDRFLHSDTFKGLKSDYFPWFNKYLKGFRRGE